MDDAGRGGDLCLRRPVTRETLARVVGKDCSIDLLIDDLIEELCARPYELVSVAGGWQHRTPAAVRRDDPRVFGADKGRGGGALRVRGDGVNGGGIFPAGDPRRALEDLWQGSEP